MSVASALAAGRSAALSRMTSTVTIRRDTAERAQDEDTGVDESTWTEVYTDLPFRLGGTRGDAPVRNVTIGDTEVQLAVRTGHMPTSTTDLQDGDLIEVTSGENEGAVFRILEVEWQDQATARRVPLIAHDRPEEWL